MQKKLNKNFGLAVWVGSIIIFAAALILLSNLFLGGVYYDLTSDNRYSLDSKTKSFLAQNKQPVAVRLYMSRDLIGQNKTLGYYAGDVRRLLEEYQRRSDGLIEVSVIEVVPFESTQAMAETAGIVPFDFGDGKKYLYLGASFTNGSGKTVTIPRLFPERQRNIEDDITRMLSVLTHDKKPVLGVISPFFKLFGSNGIWGYSSEWPFIEQLKENGYEVKSLNAGASVIPAGIDAVLVFYPVRLDAAAVYALDQYLLKGGKIIAVLDAFSDERFRKNNVYEPYNSGMHAFLQNKGVKYSDNLLVGDIDDSRDIVWNGQKEKYPFWIVANAGQNKLFLNHSGFFAYTPQEGVSAKVLAETNEKSALMSSDAVLGVNMENVKKSYQASAEKYPLVLLLEGNFSSVFDESQIFFDSTPMSLHSFSKTSEQEGKLLLIADSDMFVNSLWNGNTKRGQGFYDAVFVSDNIHFLRDMVDYLTSSELTGAGIKPVSIKSRSLGDVLYRYVVDTLAVDKASALQNLANLQEKIAVLRMQLKAAPVASVKQTKDLEQLKREEIEEQDNLRRIAYLTEERYKNLLLYFSFFTTGILPLLMVLLIGGIYRMCRLRTERKAKRYVDA